MSIPAVRVEIGFALEPNGNLADNFILDDPVRGALDSAHVLGDIAWSDVTAYARSVSVKRGRVNETDRYNAGTANVTLDNRARVFDPLNTASPYAGTVKPRRPIRIFSGQELVFTGTIEDWDIEYGGPVDDAIAMVSAVDAFALIGGMDIGAHTTTSQTSGARINDILDRAEIDWPEALRNIDTGAQLLQDDTVALNTSALTYLQLVETSEVGDLFMSRTGLLAFRGRNTSPASFSTVTFSDSPTDGGIPYQSLSASYGTELLYNSVSVQIVDGAPQTAEIAASVTEFGLLSLTRTGLLMFSDDDAWDMANWLAGLYSQPQVRITGIRLQMLALTTAQQALVLGLDLTDTVTFGMGLDAHGYNSAHVYDSAELYDTGDPQYSAWMSISSIDHTIGPDTHVVDIGFRNAWTAGNLTLDSPAFGLLDTGLLGF